MFHCNNIGNYLVMMCSLLFTISNTLSYFFSPGFQDILFGIPERDVSKNQIMNKIVNCRTFYPKIKILSFTVLTLMSFQT